MSYALWNQAGQDLERTPRYADTSAGVIDSQVYASQGRWDELAALMIYEERIPPGAAPLGYGDPVVEVEGGRSYAVRYPAGTQQERDNATRSNLSASIGAQIPQVTATQQDIDPELEKDVVRYAAAASDKQIELEGTADADLGTFDTALAVEEEDSTAVGYSRFTVTINEQTPWAGAPNNDLGFDCTLEIQTIYSDQGAEARVQVVDAPGDTGAVLPFVQDAEDPLIWRCSSRDGHKWADPEASASVKLLWGAGSLPVTPVVTSSGHNDRQAVAARYGVAA